MWLQIQVHVGSGWNISLFISVMCPVCLKQLLNYKLTFSSHPKLTSTRK